MIAELAERRALTRAQWGRWKPTTLSDHFDACAGKWPDSPFMITDETLTTYQQLVDRSWRIAGAAARAGIKPDDRLAIIMGNSADFVAAKVAASRLGAIAVPVNYLLSPPELGVVLASAKPRLVMAYGQVGPADVVSLLEKVGLPDADQLGRLDLRQLSFLDQATQLDHQRGFQLMFFDIRKAEVGKDVAAADVVRRQSFLAHVQALFVALWMVSASRRRCLTKSRCRCGVAIPLVDFFWNA